jgi:AcrR family transcriptional regulator
MCEIALARYYLGMTATKISPRERLLAAADDLFFKEGIRAVGINRVLEEARTPIMSLYRNFGSKDGLAAAYLERRGECYVEEVAGEVMRRASSPREKILATFDIIGERLEKGDFRGCPFINATVEMASPDHEVAKIARRYKEAGRQWFAEFAAEAGVPDPAGLAIQLTVLLDGAAAAAALYQDSSGAMYARSAAESLVDAALAAASTGSTGDDVRDRR